MTMLLDGTISEPYIVFADGDDALPRTNDFSGLKDAFALYNASVVLGSAQDCYPHIADACRLQKLVYPWSHHHMYGKAGTFMAK